MRRIAVLLLALVTVGAAACGGGSTASQPAKGSAPAAAGGSGGGSGSTSVSSASNGSTSSPAGSAALVPFKFSFDFTLNGMESAFYAALARGYYQKQGLAVQLVKGVTPADSIQWVATGKVNMTLDPWEEVIAADAKGAKLKVVAGLQMQSPFGLVYRSDHPITKPTDLYAASIGTPAGSAAQISLQQFIAATHLDASRVKIANTSPAAELGLLGQGKLTAMASASYDFVPLAAQSGIKVGIFPFSKYNVGATGENIVAPDSLISQHPDWIKGFLLATAQGFAYAQAHPQQAVAYELPAIPTLKASAGVQQLKLALQTFGSPNTAGKPWGWQSSKDWERIIAQTKQYQHVTKTGAPSTYYTNDLLPTGAVTAP